MNTMSLTPSPYTINSIFAFFISLFIYVHVQFHLKKSNDLDIYHIDYPSKEKLDEICDLRQPVVFSITRLEKIVPQLTLNSLTKSYPEFDINIISNQNPKPHTDPKISNTESDYDPTKIIPVKIKDASKLFMNSDEIDKINISYQSEQNFSLLLETGLSKLIQKAEYIIRPSLALKTQYDLAFGQAGCHTPLRYNLNYKNYLMVTNGSIQIKLASPKYARELVLETNYENSNIAFVSTENPWNEQNDHEIKYLYVELHTNQMIYIPAYWLYSIRYNEPSTSLLFIYYQTIMSYASCCPHNIIHYLQSHNIQYTLPEKIPSSNTKNQHISTTSPIKNK